MHPDDPGSVSVTMYPPSTTRSQFWTQSQEAIMSTMGYGPAKSNQIIVTLRDKAFWPNMCVLQPNVCAQHSVITVAAKGRKEKDTALLKMSEGKTEYCQNHLTEWYYCKEWCLTVRINSERHLRDVEFSILKATKLNNLSFRTLEKNIILKYPTWSNILVVAHKSL